MIKLAEIPRFLLMADADLESFRGQVLGRWHFVLQSLDHPYRFDAADWEPGVALERLELLTVIRGLEELDQASNVTVVTASRYVADGFEQGLRRWRQSDRRGEPFDPLAADANDDLWRRLDRASRLHKLEHRACRRGEIATEWLLAADKEHCARLRQHRAGSHRWGAWVRQLSRVASSIIPI
jgi:ribonuclease HI